MSPRLPALLLTLLAACASFPAAARFVQRTLTVDRREYRYQVFVPDGWTAAREWPVVLFLHGSGERGDDNVRQTTQGLPPWLREHGAGFPAVVVMPQAPEGSYWNGASERMARRALERSVAEFRGDRRRLYLTGLSMGDYGVWQFAVDHPGVFAAAAPVCGAIRPVADEPALHLLGIPAGADPLAWVAARIGRLPVWIFHGAADEVVPPADDRRMRAVLAARGAEVRYSEFPGVGHGSWVPAYATPELWRWLFAHALDAAPPKR